MNNNFENLSEEIMDEITNEDQKEVKTDNEPTAEQSRLISLSPSCPIEIDEWKKIIHDNFPDLVLPAEIGLSIIAQLLIEDIKNPFAMVYVDVPSSGKTIALNFFSTIKELIYTTDNITPASFVSQAASVKKKELEKVDLLPKIKNKTLIIRDLAPVFAGKEDKVREMFGIFVRVLDGEGLENDGGVHGKRGYSGEYLFMLLGASTPIKSRIWSIMGNLGSRLFFLNIEGKEDKEDDLLALLNGDLRQEEIICREATQEFIKTLWSKYPDGVIWDKSDDDENKKRIITKFSIALAVLRAALNEQRDYDSTDKKYIHTQPLIERPKRINSQLYNLARGHALLFGRTKINADDLTIVGKLAIDSAPPKRSVIFRHLILNGGSLSTDDVMKILKVSRPIALKSMRELAILEMVDTIGNLNDENETYGGRPTQFIALTKKYEWFGTEECQNLLKHVLKNRLLTELDPVTIDEKSQKELF